MRTVSAKNFPRACAALFFAALFSSHLSHAACSARYVRVENPTGMYMEWQEIEVFNAGINIVLKRENQIKGSHWNDAVLQHYSHAMLDGVTDVTKRGTDYANGLGNKIDAWFEIDLGNMTNIDAIKLYAGSYPKRQFADKGTRLITLLDADRRVVWASKWDYFESKASPAIENGVFSFIPSTMNAEVIGMKVPPPENCVEWAPMVWLLGIQKEAPPANAARRMAIFEARDTGNLAPFAKRFFDMIEPDVMELVEARNLHYEGKDSLALDAWKKYWFAKISKLELGSVTDGGAAEGDYNGIADNLLTGVRLDLSGEKARMITFTPGRIDWLDSAMGKDNKYIEKFTRGLLEAYSATGDAKYVKRWAEIMDDWSLNYFADADTSPTNVKNLFAFCEVDAWMGLLGKLTQCAKERPALVELIPAGTLARMQLICMEQYGPAYWRPTRDLLFGHATSAIAIWRRSLPTFDEFGPGRRIALEWRQHLERWMTQCTEPDGLMVANSDEPHMIIPFQIGATLAAFEKNPPEWYTPGVRNRSLEWLDNAHKDIFRHPAPGGYDFRYGCTGISWNRFVNLTDTYGKNGLDRSVVIYAIPEVRRVLASICTAAGDRPAATPDAPKWRKQLVERQQKMYDAMAPALRNDKQQKPMLNSDWMPYGGSYYFRSGWDDHDAFVSMLSRSSIGAMMANSCGQFVHYDYFFPLLRGEALKINGLDRLANTKFPRHWTKHAQVDIRADQLPAANRWLSSPRFDFGETEFTGRFQNDSNGTPIANVNQVRQVIQVRDSRLFIVTDTTAFLTLEEAKRSHKFSVEFVPILSCMKDGSHPFSNEQLQCAADSKKIATANPDGPNDTLYQFISSPLTYRSTIGKPSFDSYSARFFGAYGFAEAPVQTQWSAPGNTALVTLMSTSDTGEKERIEKIVGMNNGAAVSGFDAMLRDGGEVWYQAAVAEPANLTCGPVTATAKTLLVCRKNKDESQYTGIAMDCTNFKFKESQTVLPATDIEFVVSNGKLVSASSIYRPIDPVTFSPQTNTFTENQQVTMSSKTENVEIRYTIDGTPPTTASKLYTGPFTIGETTEIAARAYRLVEGKRIEFNDFEINGTRFTEPTFAFFYKKPLEKAIAIGDADHLTPGLNCDYLEGDWNTLYSDAHWIRPTAISTASKEMDLSKAYNPNYYFGMRYTGYIKIPTDGVYTFHAPQEFTSMTCSASYDYRVYLDGKEWDLTQWFHAHGTWSVALKSGYHTFELDYVNGRVRPWRNAGLWVYGDYPSAWVEHEGAPSTLLVSGPDLHSQPLPGAWLFRRSPDTKLNGVIMGTGDTTAIAKAFDGKTDTCFTPNETGAAAWVGLDLGNVPPALISRIRFHPQAGAEANMVSGVFQGANDPEFKSAVPLYTIDTTPPPGWSEVGISSDKPFRYLRLLLNGKKRGGIAEVEFYGRTIPAIAVPSELTATAADTVVTLSWISNSSNQDGFKIERAVAGYPYSQVATVGPKVTQYRDASGLTSGTTYHYRVRAFNAGSDSEYTADSHVTTPGSNGTKAP